LFSALLPPGVGEGAKAQKTKEKKMEKKIAKDVFTIVENKDDSKKNMWIKIGAAFVNKDGSTNVILNALPISGKCQIRDRKSK
jgi:hypothetical protein